MIDEDRTMQLFGHTNDELLPKSNKKIVVVCEECGKYRVVKKSDYRELCNLCSRPKGENSPHWKGGEVTKVCEVCGKEFLVAQARSHQKFCSRKCHGKWQSENQYGEKCPAWKGGEVTKVCEVCGKEFTAKVSAIKKGHGRFCSRECMGKWQSEVRIGENNSSWKGGEVTKVCEVCGKEFMVDPSILNLRRSCSRECYGKWMSENLCGENNPAWKEKVVKICEVCGKEFFVKPSLSHQKFCSRECGAKWQSENQRGKNNPNFNKRLSLEARKRMSATRQGVSYDEWEEFAKDQLYCPKFNERCRESNREKYDRRCFLSGKTEEENGARLSVHHIDMNKAQGCDGHAWNLVPLSKKWHAKSHADIWIARIQYLLEHVWNIGRNNVIS